DPTAGDHTIRLGEGATKRAGDQSDLVGNGLDPSQLNSEPTQLAGEERPVLVLHFGREDLVADHQDGRGAHSAMPYSRIFLISVVRETPSRSASRLRLPRVSRSPVSISSFSSAS